MKRVMVRSCLSTRQIDGGTVNHTTISILIFVFTFANQTLMFVSLTFGSLVCDVFSCFVTSHTVSLVKCGT